jgi:arginyl-tRNA synthetase
MFMWRSAPESWSFTQLVSQPPTPNPDRIRADHAQSRFQPPMSASSTPLDVLREAVVAAAEELAGRSSATSRGRITLERPPRADFGDYSTNAALLLAAGLDSSPRELAQRLGSALQVRLGSVLERFEVAGPGFLNLFLADSWLLGALADVLDAGSTFGAGAPASPERVLIEFVSANPTGPMHVGHARNAAYGDALGRVLAFHGDGVEREFYVNDAGSQVRKLGESVMALASGEPVPADGYRGSYVEQLVGLAADGSTDPAELGRAAVKVLVKDMEASLHAFGVKGFDHWAYESTLHEGDPSPVAHALSILSEHGYTYESEGALWLRTSEFADDKDRVLVRSNGEYTYFASDIAYHQDKRERGFDRQIDVWGADHHGYVLRMKAAYAAIGGDPEHLELLIMQLVHLLRGGERAQMSKRAGEFLTLDDLLAEIGVDAARWYLLARSHDTTVDLDLDLAREQSSENPVYYVQYAHARIVSMLDRAGTARVEAALAGVAEAVSGPLHGAERALVERLLEFPSELTEAAERRAPHRIAAYALELAQGFTAFYRDCRVIGVEPEAVESFRIALCVASRRTIARSLDLLGVSAPEEM